MKTPIIILSLTLSLLAFLVYNSHNPSPPPQNNHSEVVTCPDCKGAGEVISDENDPLVQLGLVEVGYKEPCQSCRQTGKMTKVTMPNGMVYYTNGLNLDLH